MSPLMPASEWFRRLPEPYGTIATTAMVRQGYRDSVFNRASAALELSFGWHHTPEVGSTAWRNLYKALRDREIASLGQPLSFP